MYAGRLKHYRNIFNKDDCISAIIISNVGMKAITIGTPCMIRFDPISVPVYMLDKSRSPDKHKFNMDLPAEPIISFKLGSVGIGKNKSSKTSPRDKSQYRGDPTEKERMTAAEISKLDNEKIDNIFCNFLMELRAYFMLSNTTESTHSITIGPRHIKLVDRVPLVFADNYRAIQCNRLSDVHTKKDISSIAEIINEDLTKNRHVSYTFNGVSSSNLKDLFADMEAIIGSFLKMYKVRDTMMSFNNVSALIDTVSISMYKLQEAMAVFDKRRTKGIIVEVFMTNSKLSGEEVNYRSSLYRLLFAKDKEGVYVIDGVTMNRGYASVPVEDSIVSIRKIIKANTINKNNNKVMKAKP